MAKSSSKGPQFVRYMPPILQSLKNLGDSGTAGEVTDAVIAQLGISESELAQTTKNGQSRVKNQIGWARFYLAKAGLVDASQHGVWALTPDGQARRYAEEP